MELGKEKPNLGMLLLKAKKPDEGGLAKDEHSADLGMDSMDGKGAEMSAAKDAMNAVKTGDAAMFSAALKDLMEICYPSLTDGEQEPETPGESEPEKPGESEPEAE